MSRSRWLSNSSKQAPTEAWRPGSFLIPWKLANSVEYLALANLGASINLMSYSLYAALSGTTLKPTRMSIRLVNHSYQYPIGVFENMLVQLRKFMFPVNFVILQMEKADRVPLILRRPFLHTADAIIRVKNKELNLGIGEDRATFLIDKAMQHSYLNDDTCFRIDVIDEVTEDELNGEEAGWREFGRGTRRASDVRRKELRVEGELGGMGFLLHTLGIIRVGCGWTLSKYNIYGGKGDGEEGENGRREGNRADVLECHKLNEATRKDHFPLPFMDQMLERLAGNKFFCFLDGFSRYFQIPIEPADQEKTTFTCPYGTYAYKRMPFGLCNAPATFQRCLIAIFKDMLETSMEVFRDDFLVFGDSFDSCLTNLEQMLIRCKQAHLVLNWEKCHFMVTEGIVLGHKVSSKGLEVDKAKIDVKAKLPPPTNVKAVRIFNFDEECNKAFETLKEKLTNAPIVVSPNWSLPFELMCDASDIVVGVVLGQRDEKHFCPIHFASKTLNHAQQNYTVTEKELLAVVLAFDKFQSYLVLSKTVLFTNHSAIKYLFSKRDVKPRLIRWILLLQEFDIEIKNKKGAKNVAANHLSRLKKPNLKEPREKEINDEFPDEFLMSISTDEKESSWFADFANYLAEAEALPTNDARVIVNFLKNLFSCFEIPKALISDRGTHFCNRQMEKILKKYGVHHRIAIAYHLQTSGQPTKLQLAPLRTDFCMLHELDELRLQAYENSKLYKARTKAYHDKKLKVRKEFKARDKVLLYNSKYKFKAPKLRSKCYGPFIVKHGYPFGYVKFYDKHGGSFIVNGHRVKLYHNKEQLNELTTEEIHLMCEEERMKAIPFMALFLANYRETMPWAKTLVTKLSSTTTLQSHKSPGKAPGKSRWRKDLSKVPDQEGAEGNVAEKKKLKKSMETNLGKLLKYNAWSTRWSRLEQQQKRKQRNKSKEQFLSAVGFWRLTKVIQFEFCGELKNEANGADHQVDINLHHAATAKAKAKKQKQRIVFVSNRILAADEGFDGVAWERRLNVTTKNHWSIALMVSLPHRKRSVERSMRAFEEIGLSLDILRAAGFAQFSMVRGGARKARLKEEMVAHLDVYVLNNGCRKSRVTTSTETTLPTLGVMAARHVTLGRRVVTKCQITAAAIIQMQCAAREPNIVALVVILAMFKLDIA
ncbi:reverse transcriptase domain-containing protein [Tanacetum coccineum]